MCIKETVFTFATFAIMISRLKNIMMNTFKWLTTLHVETALKDIFKHAVMEITIASFLDI